jgi:hypothetical protein
MKINFGSHNFTYGSGSKGNFTWKQKAYAAVISYFTFISLYQKWKAI